MYEIEVETYGRNMGVESRRLAGDGEEGVGENGKGEE